LQKAGGLFLFFNNTPNRQFSALYHSQKILFHLQKNIFIKCKNLHFSLKFQSFCITTY